MTVNEILDLLHIELTEDIYFQSIRQIIVDSFKDINTQLISRVRVSGEILDNLGSNGIFEKSDNDTIMHFMYHAGDLVYSYG